MKFHPDQTDAQTISGYGPGWIAINGERRDTSVVMGSQGLRLDWQASRFEDLTEAHFAVLATQGAELVIFGSGTKLRFPPPAWLQPLMRSRIGLETMDTQAACRTYNILAAEGRSVLVALLLEPAA